MARHIDNAFTRSAVADAARTFEPMRAKFEKHESSHGGYSGTDHPGEFWTLALTPMRLVDAVSAWTSDVALTYVAEVGANVLFGASFGSSSGLGGGRTTPAHLAAYCSEELGNGAVEAVDDHCVIVSDAQLARLASVGLLASLSVVRIMGIMGIMGSMGSMGTIEPADAAAVRRAVESNRRAWEGDFRAVACLRVLNDKSVSLETTEHRIADVMVGENMRQYLGALLDQEVGGVGMPDPAQIERLLSVSGSLLVRPIESDAFSTFVDVGISTNADEDTPAAQSLIYDLPSNSWHDEA